MTEWRGAMRLLRPVRRIFVGGGYVTSNVQAAVLGGKAGSVTMDAFSNWTHKIRLAHRRAAGRATTISRPCGHQCSPPGMARSTAPGAA